MKHTEDPWRAAIRRWLVALLASTLTVLSLSPIDAPAQASTTISTTISVRLRTAVRGLPVKAHSHAAAYSRTADFGTWATQSGQCDTRAVVLKTESLSPTTQNSYCTVSKGKWFSFYNGRYYLNAYGGTLQIDHVVPVENAWVSGAWAWSRATRARYYNDLGDPRTLVAVDAHDNEAKGDRDPTGWLPAQGRCRYVRYWVAVKIRWHLNVTSAEKTRLTQVTAGCANTTLNVTRAAVS